VTLDENDARASRILFHDKNEDQGLVAPETSNPGTAVGSDEHRSGTTGERS